MHLREFRESPEKQKDGTPIYIGDAVFYVRRYGNKESQKAIRDIKNYLYGPMHQLKNDDANEVMAHWLVEYGVANWENVENEHGPVEYSEGNARKIFLNPQYYLSLNKILYESAMEFEHYLFDTANEDLEEIKKP